MEKLVSVTAALDAGKIPSTEQLNAFIDWLTHSVIPAVQPSEETLSGQGRVLSADIRQILQSYRTLGANKNKDSLLQEAVWHLTEGNSDVTTTVDSPEQLVDKKEVSSDIDAVRSALRTLLSIAWQSLSSESSFILTDFASFTRLVLADAAEAVQDAAGQAKEGLRDVEQDVQDGKRDSLGRDKKRLEEEKDVRVAFEHGMDTLKDGGSAIIGAGQTAKQKSEDVADRATTRLQNAYYKACERAQKDQAYHSALSTLFDTLHKWVFKAFDKASDQSFTLDTFIEDTSPEQHVRKALDALKTLLDRFANPECSVDAVLDKAHRFVRAARSESVRVKAWVDKFFEHAHRSLDDPKYPRSEEARGVRRSLRQQGQELLGTDTDAGRAWAELKGVVRTFWAALAADADIERVRAAHVHLGEDVERGLVEAGEEASTGAQAVLERAAWFWRDMFSVYAPRVLAMLKDVPIPRTEYVDNDMELVLENLDISNIGINPAHIFIRNITDVDVRTSATAETTTGFGSFVHIRLQAVQLALRNVSFYYNDKTATLPPSEFTGLLELTMPPHGIDIDLKVRSISSAEERAKRRTYHETELLEVQISEDVQVHVRESNHAVVLTVFKPVFDMRVRAALGRALGAHLRAALDELGALAWDVGQRATVFEDAGAGRGAALAAAVWSELGRLRREQRGGWRATATGTGVMLEMPECGTGAGGAKMAVGVEPQVLSGEKRGPMGTGSESVEKRVGAAVEANAAKEGMQGVKTQLQGLVKEGSRQIRSFQRSVEEREAAERKSAGWRSSAFDI
ncbi:hypothetical protein GGX14DRAFT_634371, partial [Mycena pura]